jgi:tetratricopeptide (TPR) repeat protein
MRKLATIILAFSLTAMGLAGCDLLDSQNVENPELTQDAALSNPNPLERWVAGLEEQMVITLDETVIYTSIATDNYSNRETFYNQQADNLDFISEDNDLLEMLREQSELRESAAFGKEEVVNRAENPDPNLVAELDFYLGVSHLFLGESFLNAPLEASGPSASPDEHYQEAVNAFQNAIDNGNGDQTGYKLAQARAYYNLGDQQNAVDRAQEVLNEDPQYVRLRETDPVDGPDNTMQDALYDRSTLDDFQPLPRLDFLDPKYGAAGTNDTPYVLLKAEEAHLILIEAFLADGDLASAQSQMEDLLDLVEARGGRAVDESGEGRRRAGPGEEDPSNFYPDTTAYEVRANAQDPFRSGLVLNRTPSTEVPSISGTSVTEQMVNDVSNADEAWELYYLLRQEIFIAEGRRFATLGLKLPLPENELTVNDNIDEQTASEQTIPDFIPDPPVSMNAFTYEDNPAYESDPEANDFQVTIEVNMNRRLANNRQSVSPFLQ